MKRSVLLVLAWMASILPVMAGTDGQTYPEVNGLKIVNQWIFDRVHSGTAYTSDAICNQSVMTRSRNRSSIAFRQSTARRSRIYRCIWMDSPTGASWV